MERRRGAQRAWVAAAALAVVGIGMALVGSWPGIAGVGVSAARHVEQVTRPPLTPLSPAPTEEPTTTRDEIIAASPLQPVPLAPITRLRIEGQALLIDAAIRGFDAEVAVVDGVEVSVIDPPNTVDAFVWNARATEVGVAWQDGATTPTVVLNHDRAPEIFGHAGLGSGVFGNLTALAVGDRIIVTTTAGELVYEVRSVHETPKGAAGALDETNPLITGTGSPGTVLLASCVPDGPGGTSTTAAVYTAELVASRPQG